jgi:voltage-gated potassium channel
MHDFLLFVNNMRFGAYFARYILLLLGLIWIMLTVLFAWAEDQTLGNAIYFALITSLTVGYGDIAPVTPIGKAASAAIAVVGVPASTLVSQPGPFPCLSAGIASLAIPGPDNTMWNRVI